MERTGKDRGSGEKGEKVIKGGEAGGGRQRWEREKEKDHLYGAV